MTKKPTLRNLNWEKVIRSKSECFDERDPIAQAMPEPMDTNWGIRSDTEYDRKNRRKPLKLADDQAANQDDEPRIARAPNDPVEIPPAVVMQRTGERMMNRYKPLKSNIVDQTEHTIKMSNGAVLRKSGVALRKAKHPKKRAPGQITAPPTPWDLKRKLLTSSNQPGSSKGTKGTLHSTIGKGSRFQNLEFAEDSDSESEDHLPLSTTIQVGEQTVEKMVREHLVGDGIKFNPKSSQFVPAMMRRQRSTRWHMKQKLEMTGGEKIPKEPNHKRRSARQNQCQ